ncbi:unnamed protein product [Amoebophrya sp. A25]|nr:unnamed protein product [Amoebophrya sp. A25]|eukprot:GSA25T00016870001.1
MWRLSSTTSSSSSSALRGRGLISRTALITSPAPSSSSSRGTGSFFKQSRRFLQTDSDSLGASSGKMLAYDESMRFDKTGDRSSALVRYRISSDEIIRREYMRYDHGVRIGRLLEDLDAGAGDVAARHCYLGSPHHEMTDNVTACVDGILIDDHLGNIETDGKDFFLEGRLMWVGSASMMIRMRVWTADGTWEPSNLAACGSAKPDESVPPKRLKSQASIALKRIYQVAERNPGPNRFGSEHCGIGTDGAVAALLPPDRKKLLQGDFLFVALSKGSRKAVKINGLTTVSAEDKQLFAEGEAMRAKRKATAAKGGKGFAPCAEEASYLHLMHTRGLMRHAAPAKDMFDYLFKSQPLPEGHFLPDALDGEQMALDGDKSTSSQIVPICQTQCRSIISTQPQSQNAGGKIFGGQLMRQAYELAVQNIRLLLNATGHCVGLKALVIEDTVFKAPVPIGACLNYSSHVVYTKGRYAQVFVTAHVHVIGAHSTYLANTFMYTFEAKERDFPHIVPISYAEMMLNLKGRRAYYSRFSPREE